MSALTLTVDRCHSVQDDLLRLPCQSPYLYPHLADRSEHERQSAQRPEPSIPLSPAQVLNTHAKTTSRDTINTFSQRWITTLWVSLG